MGVELIGPREGRLTNGQVAIGCMAFVDKLMARLEEEEMKLKEGTQWYMHRAQAAAANHDATGWKRIMRAVDEGDLVVDATDEEHGNTLLHFACGGDGEVSPQGAHVPGKPHMDAVRWLLKPHMDQRFKNFPLAPGAAGATLVNVPNKNGMTPLAVAVWSGSAEAVALLLDVGAECAGILIDYPNAVPDVVGIFSDFPSASKLATKYYFTYGSLKRGFPNHKTYAGREVRR